ncbi:MAG: type II secretion system protein GspG [Polyangiaceae bacterium]
MIAMASSGRFGRVLLPWEKRRGIEGVLHRLGPRKIALAALLLVGLVVIQRHEAHKSAVRATRSSITTAREAIRAYRADVAGECPATWNDVVGRGLLAKVPVDAWGNTLRFVCPGRKDPAGFDVSSDGPDGLFGGTDRVE